MANDMRMIISQDRHHAVSVVHIVAIEKSLDTVPGTIFAIPVNDESGYVLGDYYRSGMEKEVFEAVVDYMSLGTIGGDRLIMPGDSPEEIRQWMDSIYYTDQSKGRRQTDGKTTKTGSQ